MKRELTAADPQGWYECQRVIDRDPDLKQVVWWNGETIEVRRGCFPHHPVSYYRDYVRLVIAPLRQQEATQKLIQGREWRTVESQKWKFWIIVADNPDDPDVPLCLDWDGQWYPALNKTWPTEADAIAFANGL